MGNDQFSILVVDDTVIYRQILSNIVTGIQDVELAGVASNGKIALSKIAISAPDMVLLDVAMPVMDGLETLDRLKLDYPDIEVIMVSSTDRTNAGLTMTALEKGALDFVLKPECDSPNESISQLTAALTPLIRLAKTRKYSRIARRIATSGTRKTVVSKVSVLSATKMLKQKPTQKPSATVRPQRVARSEKVDIIAIGVSTGGPSALQQVIPRLSELPVPIVAVQHMPPGFTASLAERLDRLSSIKVVEAEDGQNIERGVMYIAPGGHHMVVRKGNGYGTVGLNDSPPVNSCRPAVDVLFRSLTNVFGSNILTVILTGMGSDGASGVAVIRRKGGYSIVQDEESSVVWGMPAAVAEAGDADEVVSLDGIAARIMDLVRKWSS